MPVVLLLALWLHQPTPPTPPDELRARERALAATLASRDRAAMEEILAPDFVLRGAPDVTRDQWMREALDRCWGDRFDVEQFDARVVGDTAVTSFLLTFYVNPETCAPGVMRSLITDVWTREDAEWRLRVRHSSPPPGAGLAAQFGMVPEQPPRWVLASELSFVATAGNTSTRTTGFATDFTQQADRSSTRVQFTFVSSEADDVTQARASSVQARHGVQVRDGLEVFGRAGYARDRFAGIDNRAAFETGLAYTTGRLPRHRITIEGGAGFTSEERVAEPTLRFGSASGRARYVWQMGVASLLQEEVVVTSDLSTAANWRAANELSLTMSLTRLFSLKVSNGVEYRARPVAGFRRTDMRTAAALVLTLRRAR